MEQYSSIIQLLVGILSIIILLVFFYWAFMGFIEELFK